MPLSITASTKEGSIAEAVMVMMVLLLWLWLLKWLFNGGGNDGKMLMLIVVNMMTM